MQRLLTQVPRLTTIQHFQRMATLMRFAVWGLVLSVLVLALVLLPLQPLLALLAAITAGVLVIRWPWLLWVGFALLIPITSAVKWGPLSLTDLLFAGGIMLWFMDGVRRRTIRTWHHPIVPIVLLFAGLLYLSLLQATNLREASAELLKWVQFALLLAIVPTMVPREKARWLVWGLLGGGMIQGLIGLYQFIFRIGPEWFVIFGRFMRASGTFSQPNPYGGYLGLTLPVAVSLTLWALYRLKQETSANWNISRPMFLLLCYGVAAGGIGAGLLASWSRGALLGAIGALGVVIVLRSRRAALLSGLAGLVIAGALLVGALNPTWLPAPLVERFAEVPTYLGFSDVLNEPLTNENFAIVERLAHWVAALRMWERAPWLGVGPGNYATIYPEVRLPLWEEALGHAHNIYLNLLAESGIVGLLGYLVLWGMILVWLWRQWSIHLEWQNALIIGVIGVIVHLSIHNFFDNLFVQGSYYHLALWLAVVACATKK